MWYSGLDFRFEKEYQWGKVWGLVNIKVPVFTSQF